MRVQLMSFLFLNKMCSSKTSDYEYPFIGAKEAKNMHDSQQKLFFKLVFPFLKFIERGANSFVALGLHMYVEMLDTFLFVRVCAGGSVTDRRAELGEEKETRTLRKYDTQGRQRSNNTGYQNPETQD